MKNKVLKNKFANAISAHLYLLDSPKINEIKKLIVSTKNNSGEVFLFGNGASASIANHVAVDFTKENKIRARAFNNPSLLTCFSNDYGYKNLFKECIKSYVNKKDLCIFISSSGESENVINGSVFCKKIGIKSITLTGFKQNNSLSKTGQVNIHIDSKNYNVVETLHQTILLSIVEDLKGN